MCRPRPQPAVPAPGAHPVRAERDRVDGRHLEAGVVEAPVAAGDEPEDVMVARPGVEERHQPADPVADPQAQHAGCRTPSSRCGCAVNSSVCPSRRGITSSAACRHCATPIRWRVAPTLAGTSATGRAGAGSSSSSCTAVPSGSRTHSRLGAPGGGSMTGVPARSSASRTAVQRARRKGERDVVQPLGRAPRPAGPAPGSGPGTGRPATRPSPRSPGRSPAGTPRPPRGPAPPARSDAALRSRASPSRCWSNCIQFRRDATDWEEREPDGDPGRLPGCHRRCPARSPRRRACWPGSGW